jgi:hypothetical protein
MIIKVRRNVGSKRKHPAQLIDARIEELWDEGYLRNSGEVLRTNLVRSRCGPAPTNDRFQIQSPRPPMVRWRRLEPFDQYPADDGSGTPRRFRPGRVFFRS